MTDPRRRIQAEERSILHMPRRSFVASPQIAIPSRAQIASTRRLGSVIRAPENQKTLLLPRMELSERSILLNSVLDTDPWASFAARNCIRAEERGRAIAAIMEANPEAYPVGWVPPRCQFRNCPVAISHVQGIFRHEGQPPADDSLCAVFGKSNPPPNVVVSYRKYEALDYAHEDEVAIAMFALYHTSDDFMIIPEPIEQAAEP